MTLSTGSHLGPYEILGSLGAGGMGEVYRARDARLGREVAVKVLPSHLSSDPTALARFESEARAVAALSHPGILAIHDFGAENGVRFAVMELLEGETLADRIGRSPIPWRRAVELGAAIADALSAAHSRGVIHRDLKPENIFVTSEGRVKVLDFGLARTTGAATREDQNRIPTTPVLTTPGFIVGTIGYLAPEQLRGAAADARSDIFSFGCILYEMLTGLRPFTRNTAAETMAAILKEEPPDPAETGRPLPADLSRVVAHCLEKNPEERFQTARDLAFSLRAIGGTSSSLPGAARPVGMRRGRLVSALGVLALAAGLFAAGWWSGHRRGVSAPPSFRPLTFRRGTVWSARFSPDGYTIVYSAAWDGAAPELYATRLDNPESRALGLAGHVLSVSASGEMAILERAVYVNQLEFRGTLARLPVLGGTPREIAEDVRWAAWAPDASTVAVVEDRDGHDRLEYPPGKSLYETAGWVSRPVFVDGGRAIAFLDHPLRWDDRGEVSMVSLDGRRRQLTPEWESIEGLAWSEPAGELRFSAATAGVARAVFATDLRGRYRMIGRGAGGLTVQDISPSGAILATRDNTRSGVLAGNDREPGERDLSWFGDTAAADISADGRMLLVHDYSEAAGPLYAVGMRGLDGSPPFRIGDGRAMALSPDSAWGISALPTTPIERLVLLPTRTGQVKLIETGPLSFFQWACFFPSGAEILYAAKSASGRQRVYRQMIGSASPRPVTPEGYGLRSSHAVSPDGATAALTDPAGNVALLRFESGQLRPLPGAAPRELACQWTNDGKALYVFANGAASAPLTKIELATGRRTPIRTLAPADPAGLVNVSGVRVTPDGKAYAYTYDRRLSDLYLVEGWN
jgi:dipeptidyl aminopeptidase/acylaminoacyl peptidase